MGLDMYLHGRKPKAEEDDFMSLAQWRKNWHLHSLLKREFNGNDKGGFMSIPLGKDELNRLLSLLRGKPYLQAEEDVYLFQRALAALETEELEEVVYSADW